MKKFSYRLEPLLRLRRLEEDQKKRVVGSLLTEINRQQQDALDMAAAVAREGAALKEQHGLGQIDLEWVAHYRSYVTAMQQAINRRIHRVVVTQERLVAARQELAETARRAKALEKLKERRRERYDHERGRAESRMQDEISTNTFLRCACSA